MSGATGNNGSNSTFGESFQTHFCREIKFGGKKEEDEDQEKGKKKLGIGFDGVFPTNNGGEKPVGIEIWGLKKEFI